MYLLFGKSLLGGCDVKLSLLPECCGVPALLCELCKGSIMVPGILCAVCSTECLMVQDRVSGGAYFTHERQAGCYSLNTGPYCVIKLNCQL